MRWTTKNIGHYIVSWDHIKSTCIVLDYSLHRRCILHVLDLPYETPKTITEEQIELYITFK